MSESREKVILAWRDAAKNIFARLRGYRLPEARLIPTQPDTLLNCQRINLVLPCLAAKSTFGGIATAIRLFKVIHEHFEYARIIVLEEAEDQFEREAWAGWTLEREEANSPRTVVFLGKGSAILKVSSGELFIATQWKTAYQVKHFMATLANIFPNAVRPFIYLIQDFEPAFYPWSSQYLMAESTYGGGDKILAVFNTKLLADYFQTQGYAFRETHYFEPKLNEKLAALRKQSKGQKKEKLILVYGRPSSHRNAFELIVESLHEWSRTFVRASDWTIVSLGEQHKTIKLTSGAQIRSFGKVSMAEYASFLSRASVGLSLMVSPHPSYPPLEMADFGVRVITNRFAGKNLVQRSTNIVSVADASPVGIASALRDQCEEFADCPDRNCWDADSAFLAAGEEFPFVKSLLSSLLVEDDDRVQWTGHAGRDP
jgi:hypothetical protein